MLITLLDYNLKIIWKPGKEMIFADLLSRKPLENKETDIKKYEEKVINMLQEFEEIIQEGQVSPKRLEIIKKENQEDE